MLRPLNTKAAGYLILYGGFLIVFGLLGYLSNPEKVKTALMSGGTFGTLSIIWGGLGARGVRWSQSAAILITLMLAASALMLPTLFGSLKPRPTETPESEESP